jgi:inner membrane transporter RhtA
VTAPGRTVPAAHADDRVPPARRVRFDAGWTALLAAVLVLSAGSTVAKKVGAPGPTLACVRSLLAALAWQVILIVQRRRVTWEQFKLAALPGALFGVNIACFFTAVRHTRVANVEFIGALAPFIIVPAGAILLGELIPWKALVFGLPAIAGVALVAFFGTNTAGESNALGLALSLAAIVTWATYLLVSKRIRPRIEIAPFMAVTTLAAGLVLLPMSIPQGFVGAIPAHGWPWLVLLTLCNGIVAHSLLLTAQRSVGVGTISTVQLSQPALAAAFAAVLLGEHVRAIQVVGMAIVIASLGLYTLTVRRRAFPWERRGR